MERNKDYYLKVEGTPLSLEKRSIDVITASGTREYIEGEIFEINEAWVDKGLLPGHRLEATFCRGIEDVGSVENKLSNCRILDGEGNDVTEYYDIKIKFGILTVT